MVVAVPLVVVPASRPALWDFSVMKKNQRAVGCTEAGKTTLSDEGQGQIANRREKRCFVEDQAGSHFYQLT